MNHVAIIIDESSSMSYIKTKTEKVIRNLINSTERNARTRNQDTRVSIYKFADSVQCYQFEVLPSKTTFSFYPNGCTALYDAVSRCINDFRKFRNKKDTFLLLVITDGEENNSRISISKLKQEMRDVLKTDRWTITFQVPPGYKNNIVNLGISTDNVIEWREGKIEEVEQYTTSGLDSYYDARSRGITSVKNFFATDLSDITKSDLKTMTDLSREFKLLTASKEEIIKDFVEAKTKKPYIKGDAYYQLTKKEKIQPYKNLLIMDKTTKKVYGGEEARDLIGLPTHDECRVDVGNHANYDLFIQSTSVNRIVPRGAKVLVRK